MIYLYWRFLMKLEAIEIHKSYSDLEVLKGISFSINSGSAMGFLGRNGAGKTTFIRCLMDVFKPTSGVFKIDGKEFNKDDYKIGYLPEERGMYSKEQILGQLTYFGKLKGMQAQDAKKQAMKWLERLELDSYAKKNLSILSKGNQQKVQLIQTLINDPDILILDEPFSGLDPVNSKVLKEIIVEKIKSDKIVIFSSHQMSYVEEFCDDISIINNGVIVETGNLDNIKYKMSNNRYRLLSQSNENLQKFLDENEYSYFTKKNGFVVDLNNRDKSKLLLGAVNNGVDIEEFSMYKPTLDEIFIERVGKNENI